MTLDRVFVLEQKQERCRNQENRLRTGVGLARSALIAAAYASLVYSRMRRAAYRSRKGLPLLYTGYAVA
jgi:hypothetical protein